MSNQQRTPEPWKEVARSVWINQETGAEIQFAVGARRPYCVVGLQDANGKDRAFKTFESAARAAITKTTGQ